MAALVFTLAISHAVTGDNPDHALASLRAALAALVRIAGGGSEVGRAVLEHTAAANRLAKPSKYVNHLEDIVGMAVAARSSAVAGICLGLSGLPPQQTMPILLRRRTRWDLDSVAAIYGALAGAFEPDSIPEPWVTHVEHYANTSFVEVANALHAVRRRWHAQ